MPEYKMFKGHKVDGIEAIRSAEQLKPGNQDVYTGKIITSVEWITKEKDPWGSWRPVTVRLNYNDRSYTITDANSQFQVIIQDAGA